MIIKGDLVPNHRENKKNNCALLLYKSIKCKLLCLKYNRLPGPEFCAIKCKT